MHSLHLVQPRRMLAEPIDTADKHAVPIRYFTFLWKGVDKFPQDQDADQT